MSVARVVVDTPLPHLDRLFDYAVPDALAEVAKPGVRVRVRFAGKLTDGFLLELADRSEHVGELASLQRVLGSERVLTPEVADLARAVADRWAGTLCDVLRLAVPPRHATAERAAGRRANPAVHHTLAPLDRYDGGPELAAHIAMREPVRAVWSMLPGDWSDELASLAARVVAGGRGVIVVTPDARDIGILGAACARAVGDDAVVELSAGLGPQERYRRFLRIVRGQVPVVVGARAAVWAPVRNLGLVIVWDDGNDLLAEPRSPYPHTRDVAALRSHRDGIHLVIAGHSVSTDAQQLVASGWARAIDPVPASRSAAWPVVRSSEDSTSHDDIAARAARLPTLAWQTASQALRDGGPVLVQVPRRGYQPRLACQSCRSPARCAACTGPLGRPADGNGLRCSWCGVPATDWACPHCGGSEIRATVVGVRRTAEELGRAFPGHPVKTSGGSTVLATVDGGPAIVIATPGAEPVADGGYAAGLLLDGWVMLGRPDIRATEETLRRWLSAAALVRPAGDGGRVVVVAPSELPVVQALVGGRPRALAERELAERRALHLPPSARFASLTGTAKAVSEMLSLATLPDHAEVMGPVDLPQSVGGSLPLSDAGEPVERVLIRVPLADGRRLADTLKSAASVRSARKSPGPVRVVMDPLQIG